MVRRCRVWQILAVVLATLAASERAHAQGRASAAEERVRVELRLPDSCAQRDRFFAQIRQRLGTAWEAAAGELARTIHVTVTFDTDRYVARIELTDARGRQVARAIGGAECEQVIDGIALITVLAIQAQVDELLSLSSPDAPATPPTETKKPEPDPTAPSKPGKNDGGSVSSGARAPTPVATTLQLRMGGRASIQQGVGPGLAVLFGGFVGVAWKQVALGLALDTGGTGLVTAQDVRADFDLVAGRLEGCWRLRLPPEELSAEPCIFLQGGSLSAQAARDLPEVAQGRRGSTMWLAPGLLAAMRGEFGPVFLSLEASGAFSLNQESFFVEVESHTVYRVPWFTAGVGLGAGVVF